MTTSTLTLNLVANAKSSVLTLWYHRSGFKCAVKWLQMVLYKPYYDSNDCKLPSGQVTPSFLAEGVACGEAACGVGYSYPYDWLSGKMACQSDSPGPFVLVTSVHAGCWQVDCWLEVLMKIHLDLSSLAVGIRTCARMHDRWIQKVR